MKLLIVESPTKAKTIKTFLGKGYDVVSSFGHIRDLPKSEMGVDVEHNFKPHYIVPRAKVKKVNELKAIAKGADTIYFATDDDREGEAIAWHLAHILKVDAKEAKRVAFHEITQEALEEAMEHPRHIDMNLVDAQQARRILDRLVGYDLSPFLWKKVAKGLSAGRVQSAALRLIVERERELQKFKPQEYWSVNAFLKKSRNGFDAKLYKYDGKTLDKMDIKDKAQVDKILKKVKKQKLEIVELKEKDVSRNPYAPFTTSSLQQEAHTKLGFSAKQIMKIAQELYEGVDTGKNKHAGLITYMRTDSCNLSLKFTAQVKNWLTDSLGKEYAEASPRKFKTKTKSAQEAHEAIRPTSAGRTPEELKSILNGSQLKLYTLIWKRAIASQMASAKFKHTTIDVSAGDAGFRGTGNVMIFDGFLRVYGTSSKDVILPEFTIGDELKIFKIEPIQHFTEPPARFNDASLVKVLEEHGIGRPSTYAPIISTILTRGYVARDDNKRFMPKEIAFLVNDLLVKNFPEVVDYEFTAKMEDDFDEIAHGRKKWEPIISDFYKPFKKNLMEKYKEVKKEDVLQSETDEKCDVCKTAMVVRVSRYGKFLACSAFPKCRFTKPMEGDEPKEEIKESDEVCEKCKEKMVIKEGKYGQFLGCSSYPKCKNMKPINDDTGVECPECGGKVVVRRSKRGRQFFGCSGYPKCHFALWQKPTGAKCKKCKALITADAKGKEKCSNKECK